MPTNNFKAVVNENDFTFEHIDPSSLDFVSTGPDSFHILVNNRSYHAEVIEAQYVKKTFVLKVNGTRYTIQLKDKFDQLVDSLGLHAAAGQAVADIKAPMPGLVLAVQVESGQTVAAGDSLIILEAMKMENVLKAPGDGVIKSVEVIKGQAVDKNQILIKLE